MRTVHGMNDPIFAWSGDIQTTLLCAVIVIQCCACWYMRQQQRRLCWSIVRLWRAKSRAFDRVASETSNDAAAAMLLGTANGYSRASCELEHQLLDGPEPIFEDDPTTAHDRK